MPASTTAGDAEARLSTTDRMGNMTAEGRRWP